ncbi:amidohydrolase [Gehongia tenuis]|uniref:Amidohydrolase n=1 Tax=Gehongia tenuis TaxID=2763655 RepID=A0A926D4Y4_9FIRM|nr:amidohydrolase [Gehongia tenuis]MBC8531341.1 amidohydrolase [Gehongia tenuis]
MDSMLFYHGDILTMEAREDRPEAVVVEDGRIARVGTLEEALNFAPKAERVDLEGQTLMPAFIDAHSHITSFATTLGIVSLAGAESLDEVRDRIRTYAKERKVAAGKWIVGFGYDHNDLAEGRHPTRWDLDDASPDCPVLIAHASGHMGVVNSLGLQELGIDKDTPDPEGGVIGRREGEPTGYLEERAFTQRSAGVMRPTMEETLALLDEAQRVYLSYGITTAQDGLVREAEWRVLEAAARTERLILDVVGYVDLEEADILRGNPQYQNYVHRLRLGGYKMFLDGSPQGRTAWMSEPYANGEDGYRGYPIHGDDEVRTMIETALREERQLLVHCNGDAAAQQYIDAMERALQKCPKAIRPVMIHAQTVRPDQLKIMAELPIIASFFVAHTYFWGDVHRVNLGEARANRISPVKTALQDGVVYTFHQDTPVVPPDMMKTVWCAVNRLTKGGTVLGEGERISVYDALMAVTRNAAYQYFEENEKGSIKAGKLADLVVLGKNPLTAEPMELADIPVVATYKEGRKVYQQ